MSSGTPAVQAPLTGKLTFWGHPDHPLERIRDAFLQAYPNVTLEWVLTNDYYQKFQTAMAAGGEGAPDLFWMEASDVQLYGSKGLLLDVTDIVEPIKDQFIPGKLAEAFVPSKGRYFGIPGDLSVSGIYYRPDLLEAIGVTIKNDMMYSEFLDILRKIAAAGKKAVLYPVGGGGVAAAYWSWFVAQYGGSGVATCDGKQVTVDAEAGIAAARLLKDIYQTGSTLNADFWTPEYWDALNSGTLVLDFAAAWARGFWESNLNPDQLGKWRVAPLPRAVPGGPRTGVWGGATLVATARTQNPELAKAFMKFAFASEPGCQAAADWGIIPSWLPYLEGPFQQLRFKLFGEQAAARLWLELGKELSTVYCRPALYTPALDILGTDLDPIVQGQVTPDEGMKAIGDKLRAIAPDYQ
ncbi:MAG: extracellular solute-binding protein [Thermomicrobium sp.]|nr:extracellular solute-binding protein [Thermomicrobium sp.]